MIEQWWFPMLAVLVVVFGLGIIVPLVLAVRRRLGKHADAIGGLLIVLFIAYIIVGIGYALYTADDNMLPIDYPDDEQMEFTR